MVNKLVRVSDRMQKAYVYRLTEPAGRNFHPDFKPDLTPREMLALGVFGGKYMTDCRREFPKSWFTRAKLSPEHHDDSLNYFQQHASQPLKMWREKGWINEEHDPRGWFQWYCRYYLGRRLSGEDERQIKRWKARLAATWRKLSRTAVRGICSVDRHRGRRYSTGPTIAGRSS